MDKGQGRRRYELDALFQNDLQGGVVINVGRSRGETSLSSIDQAFEIFFNVLQNIAIKFSHSRRIPFFGILTIIPFFHLLRKI